MIPSARFALGISVLALTASCAHTRAAPTDPKSVALLQKARAITAEVAGFRGLPEKTPLQIELHDEAGLSALVQQQVDEELSDAEARRELARWLAFGFVSKDVKPKELVKSALGEEVKGFYLPKTKALHVPTSIQMEGAGDATEVVLAHEIEHGLQDQSFDLLSREKVPGNDDATIAQKAAYEGDATFVMMVYQGRRTKQLPPERILSMARLLQHMPTAALIELSGKSKTLLAAPALFREQMLLPYLGGLRLVAELYQVGGYQLVDRMLASPPSTTEQVLHPEKYVAGELEVPVDMPTVPAGQKEIARGHLGELGIRAMLMECVGLPTATTASAGWGGDTYLITEGAGGTLSLLWSTTWDTARDASEFAAALQELQACWTKTGPRTAGSWHATPELQVSSSGTQVVVVTGQPAGDLAALEASLTGLVRTPLPARPPVGDVKLAPNTPVPEPKPEQAPEKAGRLEHGVWTNDWYGVSLTVGGGLEVEPEMHQVVQSVRTKSGAGMGGLTFAPIAYSAKSREMVFRLLSQTLKAKLGAKAELTASADTDVEQSGVHGVERRLLSSGSEKSEIHVVFWPACDGKSTFVQFLVARDPENWPTIQAWGKSLRFLKTAPPVCQKPVTAP